jgi:dUTP pyrophosphatase
VLQKNNLGFYKLSKEVLTPERATPGSAAFDIRVWLDGCAVSAFTDHNEQILVDTNDNILMLMPGFRYKIPTGLIFDIPEGFRLDLNIRGGTGLKKGLCLANDTGIVDYDYVQELFILVLNTSKSVVSLENHERIAQVKLEKVEDVNLLELDVPPDQKTIRDGGFNSTGVK